MRFANAKAVFFDVDDTLYDFEQSMAHAFAHLRRAFPDILGVHGEDRLAQSYWTFYKGFPEDEKVELINRDPDLFRRTMWAGALKNLGLSDDLCHPDGFTRQLTDEFQRHRPEHWRAAMYDGARELLADLKESGVKLGAITNGPSPVQRPKLVALDYRRYFDETRVFVSGEFGARKPDPRIFHAAARSVGEPPESCVMIGDTREFDMPAKAIGFRTILFDGKSMKPDCERDEYPPDAIVRSYAELRALLL